MSTFFRTLVICFSCGVLGGFKGANSEANSYYDQDYDIRCSNTVQNISICHSNDRSIYYINFPRKANQDIRLERNPVCDNYWTFTDEEHPEDWTIFRFLNKNNDATSTTSDCNYNIIIDKNENCDIPGTEFKYADACSENCSILSNFTAEAFHNEIHHQIHLNISWLPIASQDVVTIDVKGLDSHCPSDTFENYPLSRGFLIYPENQSVAETEMLQHGCRYEIRIYSADYSSYCRTTTTIDKECVGKICNCDLNAAPLAEILRTNYNAERDTIEVYFNASNNNNKCVMTDFDVKTIKVRNSTLITYQQEIYSDLDNGYANFSADSLTQGAEYTFYLIFSNNCSCSREIPHRFYIPQKGINLYLILIIIGLSLLILIAIKRNFIIKCGNKIRNIFPERFQRITNPSPQILNRDCRVPMEINVHYTPLEFQEGQFDIKEFPRNKLEFKELIGRGAFGQVFSAKAYGIKEKSASFTMVAVKMLSENVTVEAVDDFKAEIEIFKKIGDHPNIVRLLGYCTLEMPLLMIMEFVPCGDLKNYLLELRKQWLKKRSFKHNTVFFPDDSDGAYIQPETPTSPVSITTSRLPSTSETISTQVADDPLTPPQTPLTPLTPFTYIETTPATTPLLEPSNTLEKILDTTELQSFALQIAKGMAHLEKIPITHRDLAARNILINEFKELKISDFGMSRSGPYINHKTKKLPLRWMALEAITQQKYDSRSDVWSFGVVLWEIATLGAFPYEKVPDAFMLQFLQMGNRLQRPEICTDELYDVMLKCWEADAANRPTFEELVEMLDVKKRKVYVDFNQLNPSYVFPPAEVVRNVPKTNSADIQQV